MTCNNCGKCECSNVNNFEQEFQIKMDAVVQSLNNSNSALNELETLAKEHGFHLNSRLSPDFYHAKYALSNSLENYWSGSSGCSYYDESENYWSSSSADC